MWWGGLGALRGRPAGAGGRQCREPAQRYGDAGSLRRCSQSRRRGNRKPRRLGTRDRRVAGESHTPGGDVARCNRRNAGSRACRARATDRDRATGRLRPEHAVHARHTMTVNTVAIAQPTFLPWLGWFDLIDQADLLILLDDVSFSRQSWQQRNRIRGPEGLQYITLPV